MAEPSATVWLDRLGRSEISSRELVVHYLERIEAVNDTLNAVVTLAAERALIEAEQADRDRAAGGERRLLGLPITVKDALETEGLVTTGGSVVRATFVPDRDATVVARLRREGAIVIAKTNLPEYSWSYETANVVQGRTNNPLDPNRTPGGSSGGEGAILGADASPVGIGTDGGGSIRVPAHYCGIVGIRPTTGRVPETGYWPPTRSTGFMDLNCIGPLSRYVKDLGLILPIIAGPDYIDPYVAPVGLDDWQIVEVGSLNVAYYTHEGTAPVTESTANAVHEAAAVLEALGCEVTESTPENVAEATDLFFEVMAADGGARARADLESAQGRHTEEMSQLLENLRPLAVSAAEFFELRRRVFDFRSRVRAFVSRFDAVVCPVNPGCAPTHGGWPGESAGNNSYQAFNHVHIYALAGVPVVSVPVGEEDGMPIGVQVVARPFREHVALAVAAALEDDLGGFERFRSA